ncbi:Two component system sensor histidine kinase CiaH [Streptococcus sp. DD10]|uniref:sensor histidine kinase n=1 Tax=Streptococcus sp. DD10 TaxID=1777878 RepID=UPI000796CD1F|nr:HAMP domain-containing sensor histidine kinase [Streptococcus sp. DD10]KXT76413.1 Two component system sensor histidine kinase CiaH [Streptococcus sp. DD10]
MWSKKNKKKYPGNFSYFLRYFGTFTIIFSMMTLIILQITRTIMYQSVDDDLRVISNNPEWVMEYSIVKSYYGKNSLIFLPDKEKTENDKQENSSDTVSSSDSNVRVPAPLSEKVNIGANTEIVLFDTDGKAIAQENDFQGLDSIDFRESDLGRITFYETQNVAKHIEKYRGILIELNQTDIPNVRYAAVLTNVNQLEQASKTNERIILMVMIGFWFISLIASQYLASVSVKPLIDSIEKQKTFVENASHELRTPLAVLQNRLENLFRKPEATILETSESIASSLEEVRNMRLLTTNLLNLARRDDGLSPEIVEIEPAFFDAIFENYSIIAEENGKNLTWNNQVTKVIKSDKTLLRQLVTILFDNAVKYTEEDGTIQLNVFVGKKDKQLVVQVADNGPGIRDSDKTHIFERFYRVDKARTRQKGGFGLGLSLAKQIVEALKGTIVVKDNQPRGTIFEVRLK